MKFHLLCLVFFISITRTLCTRNGSLWKTYEFESPVFQILWDADKEDVVVGARNAILKFDKNLVLTQQVKTGPVLDNRKCPPSPLECKLTRRSSENDVKVMLFVDQHAILVCGTVNQGMCHLFNNENISTRAIPVGHPNTLSSFVAGRDTVVAFLAKNPNDDNALYSATSYDQRPPEYVDYSVSSKVFVKEESSQGKNMLVFEYSYQTSTAVTGVSLRPSFRSHVRYIYGFSHEDFSYFLLTQRVKDESYETRLARVCHDDVKFFSYSEVSLRCFKESALIYNLATTAYLGDISKEMKNVRDVEHEDKVLYVAFGRNDQGGTPLDAFGSVLCLFPMSQIEGAFINATRECFNGGSGSKRIESLLGTETKCETRPLADKDALNEVLCDPGTNHYLEGREHVPGGIRASLRQVVTSLAITLQQEKTVAFVGTRDGHLAKLVLEVNTDKGLVYKVPLDPEAAQNGSEVRPSHTFDNRGENLYLLTGNKVVKFPVMSCSPHPSCRSCVGKKDPLKCGWCGDRCSTKKECTSGSFKQDECPPFIHKVSPSSGHESGGTVLTIRGDNFGSQQSGPKGNISITVAGVECTVLKWEYEVIECRTGAMENSSSGPVIIQVEDTSYDLGLDFNGRAVSTPIFTYLSPVLIGVVPGYGALSGGTNVTLKGQHLDIGSNQTVSLGGVPCVISRNTGNLIECTSGPRTDEKIGSVLVWIDRNGVEPTTDPEYPDYQDSFEYRPDPVVHDITPNSTTWSGGTDLIVSGLHLDSVFNPRMVVTVTHSVSAQQHDIIKPCLLGDASGTRLICRTPSLRGIPEAEGEPTAQAPIRTHISFLMDGVESLRRFSHQRLYMSQLFYYPDPVFYTFHKNVSKVRTDTMELVIKGVNLNLALRPEDVVVSVNQTLRCNVTQLTFDTLRCILPTHLNSSMLYNVESHRTIPISVKAGNQEIYLGGVTLVVPPEGISGGAVAGIALGVCVLLVALFLVLYKRGILRKPPFGKNRRNHYSAGYTAAPSGRNDYQDYPNGGDLQVIHGEQGACASGGPTGPQVSEETMHLLTVDNILIARDYLTLDKEIGQGHFGRVYKGELQLPGKEELREVAVKTLHNCRYQDLESAESFLQEGLMMKDFHHHSVLTLIGVCFEDTGFPMVILPFMKHGDLRSYIQDENNEPTIKILIDFGIQVSEGMRYLSELKFVHRDLAARNCMLDEDLTVKVADFGLSRDVYERDYYSSDNKKSKLPVKWMAPESLEKGTYSTKSDVWSFGVVLWELMTRGVSPYPEVGNWEILNFIKAGRRMLQPSYCPDMLYGIMCRCWNDDPRKRPTFAELGVEIRQVIKTMENKHKKVGLNVTYVNVPNPGEEDGQSVAV